MARKMTKVQADVWCRIVAGWPQSTLAAPASSVPPALEDRHTILTHHDCMDGGIVRCHRTVRTDTPAGSQVQGFRIHPDGTHERFI